MSDAYRTSKTIVFSLDMRQVSGIIAGTLAVLVITFSLGVGFGHRLAAGVVTPSAPVDLKKLDERTQAATVYTFSKELAQNDAPAAPAPKPAAVTAPKPVPPPAAPDAGTPIVAVVMPPPAPAPAPSPVVAVAPAPAQAPPAEPPKKDTQDRWTVQFGASPKEADAHKLTQQLTAFGYDPFIAEAEVPGKGHVYRVRIGRFATRDDADKFRASARKQHDLEGVVMGAPAP